MTAVPRGGAADTGGSGRIHSDEPASRTAAGQSGEDGRNGYSLDEFSFHLFPPNASTVATEVDLLYLFITAVSAFFVVLVAALVVIFAIKFKRRHPDEVGADIHGSLVPS